MERGVAASPPFALGSRLRGRLPVSPHVADPRGGARWRILFVSLCTLASFLLGLYHLGTPSLWGDEGASLSIASQNGLALVHAIGHDGGNFALYYLVLHLVISLFGTGTEVLRLPSVIAGAACVPLAYLMGRELEGERCALFLAPLTAFTLPLIYWSQQARGYTMVVAFLLAAEIALSRGMATEARSWLFAFVLFGVMACYTELLATIVVGVQLLGALLSPALRARLGSLLIAGTVLGAALIPLALMAAHRGSAQLFWLGAPRPKQFRESVAFLASARVNGITTATSHSLVVITLVLALGGVAIGLFRSIRSRSVLALRNAFLGVAWSALPITIAYQISRHGSPIFLDRYFLISTPALTFLIAVALAAIPWSLVGWMGVGVLLALRAGHLGPTYNVTIDNWRSATVQIVNESQPRSCVGFYFNDGLVDYTYYLTHVPAQMNSHHLIPRIVLPNLVQQSPGVMTQLGDLPAIVESYAALNAHSITAVANQCSTLLLVSNHDGHNSASRGAARVWNRFVVMRSGLTRAYGRVATTNLGSITIYRFTHATTVATTR